MTDQQSIPPAEFKYDPGDMPGLQEKIKSWADYDQLPEIELKQVIVGPDAIKELPQVLKEINPEGSGEVVLVMDKTPMERDGKSLKPMVQQMLADAGFETRVVELEGDEYGLVHPDFHEVEIVKSNLHPGVSVVSVGSGVITDITKHASFTYDQEHPDEPLLPLVFCQTANSVPAFASRMAVISKDGVKRTWPSRLSDVLIQDIKVLSEAPITYTLGGIGDTSPMFLAFADWYLGDYFGMSKYLQASWDIMEDVKALLLPYAGEIGERSPIGMEVLGKILTLGGLSMTYARESSPMSGYEHVTSHMLDMSAPYYGRQTANHGSQVAVAAIPGLIGMGYLLDELDPAKVDIDKCYPTFDEMEKKVKAAFIEKDPSGAMGEECWSDYRQKLEGWYKARPQFEKFLADWPNQKAHLESLIVRAEEYVPAYAKAGHPLYFEELNVCVPEEQGRWAYHNAHLMRKRFSHGDLIDYLGWFDEDWTDRVFARMHELVEKARS
jgi:glycerol-1-phosphate dehydrogenase [NAD(P)+]